MGCRAHRAVAVRDILEGLIMRPFLKRLPALGLAAILLVAVVEGCQMPEAFHLSQQDAPGTGGDVGTGGKLGPGTGGNGTGGTLPGTGGKGTGGVLSTGGAAGGGKGSGGMGGGGSGGTATGGMATGRTGAGGGVVGGRFGGGGGGAPGASGGAPGGRTGMGTGGAVGGGVANGGGPGAGSGGAVGGRGGRGVGGGSGSTGAGGGNCVTALAAAAYTFAPAPPCSMCMDNNGVSKETQCKSGIDCLVPLWTMSSCDNNCRMNMCLNPAGDAVIQRCIRDLVNASCGAGSLP